jgi:phage terminase large subunit
MLCEWVTFKGAAYPEFDDAHIDPDMLSPQEGEELLIAVDWGYSPSATAVLFGVLRKNVLNIYNERFEFQEHAITTSEAIYRETLRYPCPYRACGDHEPDRMDTLREHGIPVVNAVKRDPLVARTNIKELLFFDRIKIHPRCKNLIAELKAAVWDGKKDGEIDYKATPNKGHFDCEAALRYLTDTFNILHRKDG